jgi:hypothetical protein
VRGRYLVFFNFIVVIGWEEAELLRGEDFFEIIPVPEFAMIRR